MSAILERPIDVHNEHRAMQLLQTFYPDSKFEKLESFHPVDFIFTDHERSKQGWMEVKTRRYSSTAWSEYMIHKSKYDRLLRLSQETGIDCFLVYLWNDDVLTMMKVVEPTEEFTISYKRGKPRGYAMDNAAKYMIPAKLFYRYDPNNTTNNNTTNTNKE